MDQAEQSSGPNKRLFYAAWTLIGALIVLSVYLGATRIYQVDEVQYVFTSRFLGRGEAQEYLSSAPFFLLGPLAWIGSKLSTSASIFIAERMVFVAVFWVNILLVVLNAGLSIRKKEGLLPALAIATLAPWWDYGFEIRHDNLLLTGILLIWWLARYKSLRPILKYSLMGFLAALMQFMAFKAFLYWVPLLVGLVALPHPSVLERRWRLAVGILVGGALGVLAVFLVYKSQGLWEIYRQGFAGGVSVSASADRFSPWLTLERPLRQMTLVMAILGAFSWQALAQARRLEWGFVSWETCFPETALVLGTLAVLLINPTPFPYNLVLVVPFVALACAKYWKDRVERDRQWDLEAPIVFPLLASLLIFTQGIPFIFSVSRHFEMSNERQELLMTTAEVMTDPLKDRVYDGAGLVPTRKSIGRYWFLHSLNMENFRNGSWPSVEQMMTNNPPSVIIPNYRTNWLGEGDWSFIRSHFVPLSDDFWVLGGAIPPGDGEWTCIHGGRYLILVQTAGGFHPPTQLQVDGAQMPAAVPVELGPGAHHLQIPFGAPGVIVWVGPQLNQVPTLSASDHNRVFVNWY